MDPSSWLEIDLRRLDANLAVVKGVLHRAAPDRPALCCAVVKANAYGLGAGAITARLARGGADCFAVYSLAQARELAPLPIAQPVLVLAPIWDLVGDDPTVEMAQKQRLHLTVHSAEQAKALAALGRRLGVAVPVHVHLDTGMSRSGVAVDELGPLLVRLGGMPGLKLAGVYSHLASAEEDSEFTTTQDRLLEAALASAAKLMPADAVVHLANSAATLRRQRLHRGMVRVGLALLGYGQGLFRDITGEEPAAGLRPVVRWVSRINHVARYPAGASVGYRRTHVLARDSYLGVIPAGYADGYPLALSGRGCVRVMGEPLVNAPVLGRVNMDQIVIDLSDHPQRHGQALLHREVELISADSRACCALHHLAQQAGSHCYELLTRLGSHLPRRYLDPVPDPS